MRIALISDIHANLVALDTVLADAAKRNVDQIICLGDIVDLGPQPSETVDRLRAHNISCIQGNHDSLDEHTEIPPLKEIQQWTRDHLNTEQSNWLNALPFKHTADLGGITMLCVHGTPHSRHVGIDAETPVAILEEWLENISEDIIVAGHTHLQLFRRLGQKLIINAGSTGMPFEAPVQGLAPSLLKFCDYAVITCTDGRTEVELIRLPIDFAALQRSFYKAGFPAVDSWLAHWT